MEGVVAVVERKVVSGINKRLPEVKARVQVLMAAVKLVLRGCE